MAYCKKCGTKLDEDAVFCPNCGTPVTRPGKKEPITQNPPRETGSGTKLNAGNLYGRLNLEKLPEGHLIDDRYEIIRKLGQGSFGAVYLAYDRQMEIQKALKIIPEALTNDKEAMLSLKKEAAIMVKLNHKNIVRVYDFHHNAEIKYIDMEYVDGVSLADLKLEKENKKFPEEEVKKYALQIAEGLAYAHNQRVIHKDIKPQNIMRTNDGTIKLMDFGIAETVHSSMSRLKNTGSSGTLVYMSPEQLRGKDVGKESDIYSLGATLYELLTGNPPFYQGDTTYQIINETPKPITGVSQQMNDVVLKCLDKEKKNRFKNCKELSDALKNPEKFLKNKMVKIKEQHPSGTIKINDLSDNPGGKNRQTWVPWTIFLFLIAAGMVSYFLFFASSRKAKQVSKTGETKITKSMIKDSTAKLSAEKNAQSKSNKKVATVNKPSAAKEKLTANKRMVQIAFVSIPQGAEVIVNGQSKGKTPVIFSQQKGLYKVELTKELYYDTTLIINFDKNQKFDIPIKQKAKIVTINTKPEGSALYLDGENKGTTPLKLAIDFGEHQIRVVKGKYTIKKNILFSEKSPQRLNFKMNPFVNYTETAQNLNLEMVAVKGGTFQMGSNDGEADEKPVHSVTLSNYYIGKYEVTQKQWKAIMGNNPSYFKGDNLPVENVSWNDVQEFLRRLNQRTGKHYRLPTEAEWEYAARGGNKSSGYKYSGSDNLDDVAWYNSNSGNQTHPVGQKAPNELGIYDMSGNVWEWCSDWYGATYYNFSPETNPRGLTIGTDRVQRGGSWSDYAYGCCVTCRYRDPPVFTYYCYGFRVAR